MALALHPRQHQVRMASGLDMLAGVWLFVSAFIYNSSTGLSWSFASVGLLVAILGVVRVSGYRPTWPNWCNAVLGLWTIAAPWVIGGSVDRPTEWNAVISGLIIVVLAVWSATASGKTSEGSAAHLG